MRCQVKKLYIFYLYFIFDCNKRKYKKIIGRACLLSKIITDRMIGHLVSKWSKGEEAQLTVLTGILPHSPLQVLMKLITSVLNITGNFLFVLLKDFSQAERNRYEHMVAYLQRIGNAPVPEMRGMPAMKSLNSFRISYRFPKCPGIQEITGKSLLYTLHKRY